MHATLFIPWFRPRAWAFDLPFVGEVTLQPFAVLVWLGLLVGLLTAMWFAKTHKRSVPQTLNLALYLVLFAFPISYVLNAAFYLPETFQHVVRNPSQFFEAQLGWSMFGGIIGSIVGAWVWKWRTGDSILRVGDAHAFAGLFDCPSATSGCRRRYLYLRIEPRSVSRPPTLSECDLAEVVPRLQHLNMNRCEL